MDQSRRGNAAETLLNDPAYREATEAIERQIVEKLKAVQLDGKAETERYALELVRCLQAQARQTRYLWTQVEHGRLADHALEKKRAFRKGGL